MNDKITIDEEELQDSKFESTANCDNKIVFCELSTSGEDKDQLKSDIPYIWYILLLLPFVNFFGIGWAYWQKSLRFRSPVIALSCAFIISFVAYLCFVSANSYDEHWKTRLAKKAQSGVVFVEIEDKGWFTNNNAMGTGIVIAKKGNSALIITNRHVVSNRKGKIASLIQTVTSAGVSLPTEIVGLPTSMDVDMALLRVQCGNQLEVLGDIGDFNTLNAGDEVVAIGHPHGLSFTMTNGIVSALRESMLIQSSASINPGNSGGPLLNKYGRIIGINSFFIKNSQGLNFAFRADYVMNRSGWQYYSNIDSFLSKIKVK